MPRPRTTRSRRAPAPAKSAVSAHDLETARLDALLQLRLGRTAHLLTVVISGLLGVDAVLLLFSPNLPRLALGEFGGAAIGASFYLLLPIVAAVAIAWAGLVLKWKEFSLWPWESHFSITVAATALSSASLWVYGSRIAGVFPWATIDPFPWLFPLSLLGSTLALVGFARTWTPWGARQWVSALAASAPLVTALWVYYPPVQAAAGSEPLATALLISAVLYQTSGSMLHLLSSGTEAHRTAVVLSGQDRIGRLAEEIGDREETLREREMALLKREAEADVAQAAARRDLDLARSEKEGLTAVDRQLTERAEKVSQSERALAVRQVEVEGRERMAADAEASAQQRAQEAERWTKELDERSARLAQSEGELARHRTQLNQIQAEIERRAKSLTEDERRGELRQQQLEERGQELLRREGDIAARELAVGTKGRASASAPSAADREMGSREARSRQLKTLLDEQNALLARRTQEAAAQARAAETALRQHADQMAQVAAREAIVGQKEADLLSRTKASETRRAELDRSVAEYQHRLSELTQRESALAGERAAMDEALRNVPKQREELARKEKELTQGLAEFDRREAQVLARERAVQSSEAELGVRRARFDSERAHQAALAAAPPPTTRPARAASGPSVHGTTETPEATPDTLTPAPGRKYGDRLPSGTARLDDLLLGGLPPRSNVAVVGEAFVGKEIALYAFLAEGLRRSQGVVIITATRSPEEIAQSLAVVLPQFPEHERLGRVAWVDSSGGSESKRPGRIPVTGSDPLAGTVSAVVKALNQLKDGGASNARVGLLGLSALLAGTEERASMAFLQNLLGTLKARDALAMYSLDAGAMPEGRVESVLARMDGAILFRQDRDRTFLSVRGLGDVETREWIECRATSRALVVGSFALERIR